MIVPVASIAGLLDQLHYLGAARRGAGWLDDSGVLVLAKPTSRVLPSDGSWLELSRWCLIGRRPNAGSEQWARVRAHVLAELPLVTTIVSYSDPAAGHTGALYRACNWVWAPTWHRLRPPPSGNGSWGGGVVEAVKDRWVCCLRPDERRPALLVARDESILRRWPWARWIEPRFRRARHGRGGLRAFQRNRHVRPCGCPRALLA